MMRWATYWMATLATTAFATSPAAAQKVEAHRSDQARLTIPVYINNAGPFDFLVDTAATASVISPDLVRRLSLPTGGYVELQDAHKRAHVELARVDSLRVGDSVSSALMPILKAEDIGADGIIGADMFQGRNVSIDMKRHEVVINADTRAKRDRAVTGRIAADPRRMQMFLTDADIDDHPITVVVDSGSSTTIINQPARKMLGRAVRKIAGQATLVSVTGAESPLKAISLDRLRVGNFMFRNAPVGVADLDVFADFGLAEKPAMLLGMNLLAKFDEVALDFKHKRIDLAVLPDARDLAMSARFSTPIRPPIVAGLPPVAPSRPATPTAPAAPAK